MSFTALRAERAVHRQVLVAVPVQVRCEDALWLTPWARYKLLCPKCTPAEVLMPCDIAVICRRREHFIVAVPV